MAIVPYNLSFSITYYSLSITHYIHYSFHPTLTHLHKDGTGAKSSRGHDKTYCPSPSKKSINMKYE